MRGLERFDNWLESVNAGNFFLVILRYLMIVIHSQIVKNDWEAIGNMGILEFIRGRTSIVPDVHAGKVWCSYVSRSFSRCENSYNLSI